MNEILVTLKLQPFCMVAPSLVGGPTIRHWSLEVSSGGDSFFCSFRSNELQSMVWSTILVIPPNFFVKPSPSYGHPQQAATTYWLLLLTITLTWSSDIVKLAKISLSVKVNEDRRHIVVFVDKINFGFFDQNKFFYVKSQHQHHGVWLSWFFFVVTLF